MSEAINQGEHLLSNLERRFCNGHIDRQIALIRSNDPQAIIPGLNSLRTVAREAVAEVAQYQDDPDLSAWYYALCETAAEPISELLKSRNLDIYHTACDTLETIGIRVTPWGSWRQINNGPT